MAAASVAGSGIELGEDVDDVGLDRPAADEQRLGDLGVGLPRRQQPQHLLLAAGKAGGLGRRRRSRRRSLGNASATAVASAITSCKDNARPAAASCA